jgi:hypothetical protein
MKHKIKISVSVFNDSKNLSYEVAHFLFPDEDRNNLPVDERNAYTAMQVTFYNIL